MKRARSGGRKELGGKGKKKRDSSADDPLRGVSRNGNRLSTSKSTPKGASAKVGAACPTSDAMELSEAISLAFSQCSKLPLGNDTSHHCIGMACRVYWDDEGRWFTARVLLYDPGRDKYFIHYDEDLTTEWIDVSDNSDDGVLLVERLVINKGYPAVQFRSNVKARKMLGIKIPVESYYIEFFEHKKAQGIQYTITSKTSLKPLHKHWPETIKATHRLGFDNAKREVLEIRRIRQLVLDGCKNFVSSDKSVYVGSETSDWQNQLLGLRVRTSSCASSAAAGLFNTCHQKQDTTEQKSEDADQEVIPLKFAKCFGTITSYCPGNDEHFVVFDNAAAVAPKWISLKGAQAGLQIDPQQSNDENSELNVADGAHVLSEHDQHMQQIDIAGRPNDVELQIDWRFPEDYIEPKQKKKPGRKGRPRKPECAHNMNGDDNSCDDENKNDVGGLDGQIVCGLCGLGNETATANLVRCNSCKRRYFHRHCMPLSRLALSESDPWRCWYCIGCESCECPAWNRRLQSFSILDILNEEVQHVVDSDDDNPSRLQMLSHMLERTNPTLHRSMCQLCVGMIKGGKGFCSICFKKYLDDIPSHINPSKMPNSAEVGEVAVPTSEVMEDSQLMVCCDECNEWVHSKCEGIDLSQYESIANGTHPVWGNEYLCPLCRIKLPLSTVIKLFELDPSGIFHYPITTEIAATYFDVIRNPMDLSTMKAKASRGQYKALQSLRDDFELMCLNALTFNKRDDEYWTIAKLYYSHGVSLFASFSRKTICSAYGVEVNDILKLTKTQFDSKVNPSTAVEVKEVKKKVRKSLDTTDEYKKSYISRKRKDQDEKASTVPSYAQLFEGDSAKKRKTRAPEVVALAESSSAPAPDTSSNETAVVLSDKVYLPKSLHSSPVILGATSDPFDVSEATFFQSLENSLRLLLPFDERVASSDVLFYSCCRDACAICASSGSPEYFLFCTDCGECFHSFCVDAPLPLMREQEVSLSMRPPQAPENKGTIVSAKTRWRCPICSTTCSHCMSARCLNPSSGSKVVSQEALLDASRFVHCSVCQSPFHAGCISFLSKTFPDNFSEFVCWHCCFCRHCSQPDAPSEVEMIRSRIGSVYFEKAEKRVGRLPGQWGFSSGCCVQCSIRNAYLAHANGDPKSWPPSQIVVSGEKCAACHQDAETTRGSAMWCSLCFQVYHKSCVGNSPTVGNFICRRCKGCRQVLLGGGSHLGDTDQSVKLLNTVADIQRSRKSAIPPNKESHKGLKESKDVMLHMVLIAWASRRCEFMSQSPLAQRALCTNLPSIPTPVLVLRCNEHISKSATAKGKQFLSMWSDPHTLKSKKYLFEGGLKFPQVANSSDPLTSLVSLASNAAAFLHETSEEIEVLRHRRPDANKLWEDKRWLALPPLDMVDRLVPYFINDRSSGDDPRLPIMKDLKQTFLSLLQPHGNITRLIDNIRHNASSTQQSSGSKPKYSVVSETLLLDKSRISDLFLKANRSNLPMDKSQKSSRCGIKTRQQTASLWQDFLFSFMGDGRKKATAKAAKTKSFSSKAEASPSQEKDDTTCDTKEPSDTIDNNTSAELTSNRGDVLEGDSAVKHADGAEPDTSSQPDASTKSKKRKEFDKFRHRWELYESQHRLQATKDSLLPSVSRMPTAMSFTSLGWQNNASSTCNGYPTNSTTSAETAVSSGSREEKRDTGVLLGPIEICTFCHGVDEDAMLGRLVPFTGGGRGGSYTGGLWAHVNCARTAMCCREVPSGALVGAEKAQERAAETTCALCGEVGAAVKCEKPICKDFFHLKCAIACDFSFSEVKRIRYGVRSKLGVVNPPRRVGKKIEVVTTSHPVDRKQFLLAATCEAHRQEGKRLQIGPPDLKVLRNPLHKFQIVEDSYQEDAELEGFQVNPLSTRSYNQTHTCNGMQHKPLELIRSHRSGNALQSKEKVASASQLYWEHRQNVIEEKTSLLKAGGHGLRIGALTIHQLGSAGFDLPGHHSSDLIYPVHFRSTRIFWSRREAMKRVLYTFEIQSQEFDENNRQQRLLYPLPRFVVSISDEPDTLIVSNSLEQCFISILDEVRRCNASHWPGMLSALLAGSGPHPRDGENIREYNSCMLLAKAASFFGVSSDLVRFAIETQSEALATMVPRLFYSQYPMCEQFAVYQPRFHLPGRAQLEEVLRRRAQLLSTTRKNLHGSSRAEGWQDGSAWSVPSAGLLGEESAPSGKSKRRGSRKKGLSGVRRGENFPEETFKDDWTEETDDQETARRKSRILKRYREMSESFQLNPFEKLEVRRSHIHGYGLYAKTELAKDDMIIEYIGEQVRQVVADIREVLYEEQGLGSCYLFRLDKDFIVDATHTGSMARFINHCCEANAYARVISVDPGDSSSEDIGDTVINGKKCLKPFEKRIVIFAGRTIQPDEEITYDYKFPIENEKLKCYCGAAKCKGSMN